MTIALMLVGMIALAVLNVPIAIALGLVAMIAIWTIQGSQILVNTALVMFDGASSFPLSSMMRSARCWRQTARSSSMSRSTPPRIAFR